MHIDVLKMRTKCARCGQVVHWAKECVNEPDDRPRMKRQTVGAHLVPTAPPAAQPRPHAQPAQAASSSGDGPARKRRAPDSGLGDDDLFEEDEVYRD